jgi:hypothetical protein
MAEVDIDFFAKALSKDINQVQPELYIIGH